MLHICLVVVVNRLRIMLPTIEPKRLGGLSSSLVIDLDLLLDVPASSESDDGEEKKDETG